MTTRELEFDRSLLGVAYPAGTFHVDAKVIRWFCQAIGETNPIHTDETAARTAGHPALVAPSTFCTVFVRGLGRPDIKLSFGGGGFHAGEAIDVLAPIYAGDTLTAITRLKDVYAKTGRSGAMVFVVWETTYTNQDGKKVALSRNTTLRMDNLREKRNAR